MRLLHFSLLSLGLSLIWQVTASNIEDLSAKDKSNVTKPKLEPEGTDIKTATPIEIEPANYSEENTPQKRDLNDFLEVVAEITTFQNVFFKHFTNIYSFDCKTKTLTLNGDSSSEGFSWEVYVLRVCYSKLSIKTLIFKNLAIGRIIFKTIKYFLCCYQDTLEALFFDRCFFSPIFAIQDGLKLNSLYTAKITHCALDVKILKNILDLFPRTLQTLELSQLYTNSSAIDHIHYRYYLTLDFSSLNVHERFPDLKNLAVKGNDIINFPFENFKNLEKIEANDRLFKSFDLTTELEKLSNLKVIKASNYNLKDYFNYFARRKITIDSDTSTIIQSYNLSNIHNLLSTVTNVSFDFNEFVANDINRITWGNESNFKHLKSVTFHCIKHTYNIAFMKSVLTHFQGIRSINFNLCIKNITVNQINESFLEIATFDKIENVHFADFSSRDTSATCEFIIQILKRVPNLKSLFISNMSKDVIDLLFNRLQEGKLKFSNLKKINTNYYGDVPINLLLWFIQTFNIEELIINSCKLLFYSNEPLNFSSKTLNKPRINSAFAKNNVILKKCFHNIVNLRELYFFGKPDLIKLFENNSTTEKVTFEYQFDVSVDFDELFAVLKTFKNLKCICVKYVTFYHSSISLAFRRYFEKGKVELFFLPHREKV